MSRPAPTFTPLWKRVHAAAQARGMEMRALLEALPWPGPRASRQKRLDSLMRGRRTDGRTYTEPPEARAQLAVTLGLPPWALADDARWRIAVERGEERVEVEL